MKIEFNLLLLATALVLLPGCSCTRTAPLAGHYVPGVEGIKGASLPPPGFYFRDYNVFYVAGQVNNANGDKIPVDYNLFIYANLVRPIWITDWQVLGGNYGMDMIVPIQNTDLSIKSGSHTIYDNSVLGIGDLCFEPATLSWHGKQYDASVGYAFFAPTGDSEPGTAKAGKGFWTHMLTAGGTWYFDAEKTWALSALNRYEFNTEEKDTHITPGQDWTIEWGLSKNVCQTVDFGLIGYYQLQTTKDSGYNASSDCDQVVSFGPEINVVWPKLGLFTSLRYAHEFVAEDRPQGDTIALTFTKRF